MATPFGSTARRVLPSALRVASLLATVAIAAAFALLLAGRAQDGAPAMTTIVAASVVGVAALFGSLALGERR